MKDDDVDLSHECPGCGTQIPHDNVFGDCPGCSRSHLERGELAGQEALEA